jgi:predicted GH43/DUF377 family glycosyl hydrolase
MSSIPVARLPVRLAADAHRTITKPYLAVDDAPAEARTRIARLIRRILGLSPDEVTATLEELEARFGERHDDLDAIFERGFLAVAHAVPDPAGLPDEMRRLVGAYFMHEYSLEAAALTNPSIVAHPEQSGLQGGSLRVIVSLRSIGEGHLSSIEFRTGVIGRDGSIEIATPGAPMTGHRQSPMFDKAMFAAKLTEMGATSNLVVQILGELGNRFTMDDLDRALADLAEHEVSSNALHQVTQVMHWLASSNYELGFAHESDLSQRVLFPNAPTESRGMEDARMVRFLDTDGSVIYYATYTAYDGFNILPQLIETADFETFRIATLNGSAASNKGIAIFPRRIGGQYVALSRCDGENNYLMRSDHVRFWHDAEQIQIPARPWELMQIGNAGSPLETEAGWLVITHGVGPMRQYALGAILLDIDEPSRVIGRLRDPLLVPDTRERDGYVPNVVYSCGSLIHDSRLVIAYGASDTSSNFAAVPVDALLAELT